MLDTNESGLEFECRQLGWLGAGTSEMHTELQARSQTCRCAFAAYRDVIFIKVIRLLLMNAGYRIVKGINLVAVELLDCGD